MEKLPDKPLDLLQNEVVATAHRFAVSNKIKVIGSNSKRGLLFGSDMDFISEFSQRPKALVVELQKVFRNGLFMKQIYFMDMKCGLDERFGPEYPEADRDKWLLRWTPRDVIRGYVKLHDGKKKMLEDAVQDKTTFKIDWIYKDPLIECSLNITYAETPPTKEEEIQSLKADIDGYLKTNTMKSMKRLYSLLVLTKSNKTLQKQLVAYFNSEVGLVNKAKNDLELIQDLLSKHRVKVDGEIQQIKAQLGNVSWVNADVLKEMSVDTLRDTIVYLQSILNKISKTTLEHLTKN